MVDEVGYLQTKNLRTSEEFERLRQVISERADGAFVIFVPAVGNWGDGLINFGSRQFFESNDILVNETERKFAIEAIRSANEVHEKVLVIVGGGGSWCKNFGSTRAFVESISGLCNHVVVLPSTYELPACEQQNITYFSRDKFLSIETIPQSIFCHDMAFFSEIKIVNTKPKLWRLFAMRGDREGQGHASKFEPNVDVSRFGDGTYRFVDPFFQIISTFNIVTTDRLHVAIAGSMLGLKVNLVGGNYAKNRDLWKSSLRDSFPKCSFRSIEEVMDWYRPGASLPSAPSVVAAGTSSQAVVSSSGA